MTDLRKPYCSHASATLTSSIPDVLADVSCPCCGVKWKGVPYKRIAFLVQPKSRLRVEEKCEHWYTYRDGQKHYSAVDCPACHGTGTISRPATMEEIVRIAECLVPRIYAFNLEDRGVFVLKDGERVTLKEEP